MGVGVWVVASTILIISTSTRTRTRISTITNLRKYFNFCEWYIRFHASDFNILTSKWSLTLDIIPCILICFEFVITWYLSTFIVININFSFWSFCPPLTMEINSNPRDCFLTVLKISFDIMQIVLRWVSELLWTTSCFKIVIEASCCETVLICLFYLCNIRIYHFH